MNQEKFEKKIQKRYGVDTETLKDLNLSKIKSLENINTSKLKETKKFKVFRNIGNTLVKGGTMGAGVAGAINTAFPNIIPVAMSALTTSSNMSTIGKALGYIGAASKPVAIVSGPTIIGVGAGIGAILYGSFKLIKSGYKKLRIINDRNKAKRLCK